MLHIKLKRITIANSLHADRSLKLGMGSLGQNSTCSEHGHDAYQIKGNQQMQQYGSKYFACTPLPGPAVGDKRSKFYFFRTWLCCISN